MYELEQLELEVSRQLQQRVLDALWASQRATTPRVEEDLGVFGVYSIQDKLT